jgi:predicted lactoylglutathione lyase
MAERNLSPVEIKAFVPAKDFGLSKTFYEAVGFRVAYSDDEIAYLLVGNCSFLLQNFYQKELAENLQMHLLVENVDDWHTQIQEQGLPERFGVTVGELVTQPWAMREFVLTDPSGVCWRIAQNL